MFSVAHIKLHYIIKLSHKEYEMVEFNNMLTKLNISLFDVVDYQMDRDK